MIFCDGSECGDRHICRNMKGECGVERKHYYKDGVSCLSDVWFCRDCDGDFYWEGLHFDGDDPEDGQEWDDNLLCHCCFIAAGGELEVREKGVAFEGYYRVKAKPVRRGVADELTAEAQKLGLEY